MKWSNGGRGNRQANIASGDSRCEEPGGRGKVSRFLDNLVCPLPLTMRSAMRIWREGSRGTEVLQEPRHLAPLTWLLETSRGISRCKWYPSALDETPHRMNPYPPSRLCKERLACPIASPSSRAPSTSSSSRRSPGAHARLRDRRLARRPVGGRARPRRQCAVPGALPPRREEHG